MRIELQRGKFLRLDAAAGKTIRAHAGSLWITEEDSPSDVVLEPGESYRLERTGLALVEAVGDASLTLEEKA